MTEEHKAVMTIRLEDLDADLRYEISSLFTEYTGAKHKADVLEQTADSAKEVMRTLFMQEKVLKGMTLVVVGYGEDDYNIKLTSKPTSRFNKKRALQMMVEGGLAADVAAGIMAECDVKGQGEPFMSIRVAGKEHRGAAGEETGA